VLRDVRLRALVDAPHAFASTHVREVDLDEAEWRARIGRGPWWFARADGVPGGLVAAYRTDDAPDVRHLVSMWVEPALRGSAAATALVAAVCAWAAGDGGRRVSLWCADGNDRARRFYERLRFTGTGQRQPLPSAPDVGEERLELVLGANPRPRLPAAPPGRRGTAGDPRRLRRPGPGLP
jgi:RimJ/RimL family protein N-acetyltransferase